MAASVNPVGVDHDGLDKACATDDKKLKYCNLLYAGADAKAFAETVAREMGPLHEKVVTRLLVNGAGGRDEPTKANIEFAVAELTKSGANDTLADFLAGYGAHG